MSVCTTILVWAKTIAYNSFTTIPRELEVSLLIAAYALIWVCILHPPNHPVQSRHPSGCSDSWVDDGCHPQPGQSFLGELEVLSVRHPLAPCDREINIVCLVYQANSNWNLTCHQYAWMNWAGNEQHCSFWIGRVITVMLAQESLSTALEANYAKALWTDGVCPILQAAVLLIHFLLYSTKTRDEPPHNQTYQRMMGGSGKSFRYLEKHRMMIVSLRLCPRTACKLRQWFVCLASLRIKALVLPTADAILFCSARAWREGKGVSREGYKSGRRVRIHAL